jgi:hypothetical protein
LAGAHGVENCSRKKESYSCISRSVPSDCEAAHPAGSDSPGSRDAHREGGEGFYITRSTRLADLLAKPGGARPASGAACEFDGRERGPLDALKCEM